MNRLSGIPLLFAATASLSACLWDHDTVAMEARGNQDLLFTLTGRFDRWPASYYQMRAQRVLKELAAQPKRLELYDDLAVAYDRLGQSRKAIAVMASKKRLLDALGAKAPEEQRYRWAANEGTFWAHAWISEGARRERIGDLVRGRNLILKALKINPDAHFGREVVQLSVHNWLLARAGKEPTFFRPKPEYVMPDKEATLGPWIRTDPSILEVVARTGDETLPVRGLAGLILMGNGWKSPDLFLALGEHLAASRFGGGASHDDSCLAAVAYLRAEELRREGAVALSRDQILDAEEEIGPLTLTYEDLAISDYKALRKDADAWRSERLAYLVKGLNAGRHPDTDPQFWADYRERPPMLAQLTDRDRRAEPWNAFKRTAPLYLLYLGIALVLTLLVLSVVFLWIRIVRSLSQ